MELEADVLLLRLNSILDSDPLMDHKLGISTDEVLTLFLEAKKECEVEEGAGGEDMEDDLMRHSRALVLLSSDFGTAWNSRKMIVSKKGLLTMFTNELQLFKLILSYAPKSEQAWSHSLNLQEILRKESKLVEKIAKIKDELPRLESPWLVGFIYENRTGALQTQKSKSWAGLYVADNSSFHYHREELNWNETLLKRYIGREALWLHRRFLFLCWIRHFSTCHLPLPCNSENITGLNYGLGHFLDEELNLVSSCLVIPDNHFDDFEAQAIYSATYTLWLAEQLPRYIGVEFVERLRAKNIATLACKFCPNISFLEIIEDTNQSET